MDSTLAWKQAITAATVALDNAYYQQAASSNRRIVGWVLEEYNEMSFLTITFEAVDHNRVVVEYRRRIWSSNVEMDPETSGLLFSANLSEKINRMRELPPFDASGKLSL